MLTVAEQNWHLQHNRAYRSRILAYFDRGWKTSSVRSKRRTYGREGRLHAFLVYSYRIKEPEPNVGSLGGPRTPLQSDACHIVRKCHKSVRYASRGRKRIKKEHSVTWRLGENWSKEGESFQQDVENDDTWLWEWTHLEGGREKISVGPLLHSCARYIPVLSYVKLIYYMIWCYNLYRLGQHLLIVSSQLRKEGVSKTTSGDCSISIILKAKRLQATYGHWVGMPQNPHFLVYLPHLKVVLLIHICLLIRHWERSK